MWKYNNTNDMYSPELYHSADELYHYGVIGMRWRHRKNPEVRSAYDAYRKSKARVRKEKLRSFKYKFKPSTYLAGVDNKNKRDKNFKGLNDAKKAREKAAFKLIDAASKDAYNKKLSKTGSKEEANKAAMKVHLKAFKQGKYSSGRVDSIADSEGGQRKYYNHLVKTQGKDYANNVERKYNSHTNRAMAAAIIGTAAAYGTQAYLKRKGYY